MKKVIIITNNSRKVVVASVCNGDESIIADIRSLIRPSSANLTVQLVDADSLGELYDLVLSEVNQAARNP
jgi:hypothetical protein